MFNQKTQFAYIYLNFSERLSCTLYQPVQKGVESTEMSVLQEINPHVRNMKPMEYAILALRAARINKELREVRRKGHYFLK